MPPFCGVVPSLPAHRVPVGTIPRPGRSRPSRMSLAQVTGRASPPNPAVSLTNTSTPNMGLHRAVLEYMSNVKYLGHGEGTGPLRCPLYSDGMGWAQGRRSAAGVGYTPPKRSGPFRQSACAEISPGAKSSSGLGARRTEPATLAIRPGVGGPVERTGSILRGRTDHDKTALCRDSGSGGPGSRSGTIPELSGDPPPLSLLPNQEQTSREHLARRTGPT